MDEVQGRITISPAVLTTIVRLTALENPGVHKLAPQHAAVRGLRSSVGTEEGVIATVTDQGVKVELHIIVEPDANMLQVGEALQGDIKRAIEHMVDMPVRSVDVYIEGVALGMGRA